jgi:hypothetical protein
MRDAPRPGAGSDANGITSSSTASDRPVVLGDVARRAGVSAMTVSRVLNERPGVGDNTRALVFAAAAELGYRPNRLAQALVTGRSQVLAVVSFDTAQYGPAATVFGVEQAARQAGYAVQITTLRPRRPVASPGRRRGSSPKRSPVSFSRRRTTGPRRHSGTFPPTGPRSRSTSTSCRRASR